MRLCRYTVHFRRVGWRKLENMWAISLAGLPQSWRSLRLPGQRWRQWRRILWTLSYRRYFLRCWVVPLLLCYIVRLTRWIQWLDTEATSTYISAGHRRDGMM